MLKIPFGNSETGITLNEAFFILQMPVTGLAEAPDGSVWISAGLAHMGGLKGSLFRYDGENMKLIIGNCESKCENDFPTDKKVAGVRERGYDCLPKKSDLNCLYIGPDGYPYVIAPLIGVFRIVGNDKAEWLFEGNFRTQFSTESEAYGKYGAGNSPTGLVVDRDGNIFVSTTFLEIFAFLKNKSGYQFRQIIFSNQP